MHQRYSRQRSFNVHLKANSCPTKILHRTKTWPRKWESKIKIIDKANASDNEDMRSCRIRQPGQVPLVPLQLWCLLCNLSFRSEQWKCQGSDFLLVGWWCLSVSSRKRVFFFHLPSAELCEMEQMLLSLSFLTVVWMPFSIPSESSPRNTHNGGFIQNTTPPQTQ